MSFATAGQLFARDVEGEKQSLGFAGFVPARKLKLSLVPEKLAVQDVRRGKWGSFTYDKAKIEIVQRGTLSVEYENPENGEQAHTNIDCGILPTEVLIPNNLILSTKDVSKIFPHVFPVDKQSVVLHGSQYLDDCLICGEVVTGSCVLHGRCGEIPIHQHCLEQWFEEQLPTYPNESLLDEYPKCPNCHGAMAAPWLPRSPAAALNAAVASALGEGFQVVSEHPVPGWSLWSHHPVNEEGFILWVIAPKRRLKRYFLRKRDGPAAEDMSNAEYTALSVISKTSFAGRMVPRPAGLGKFWNGSVTVYFNINDYLPDVRTDPVQQARKLLEFHNSEEAQGNKFGFSAPTLSNERAQYVTWHDDWVGLLENWTKDAICFNMTRYGPWQFEEEFISTFQRLVNVLIKPLNTKSSLSLGNLYGNLRRSVIHNPSPIYGHDEWEWAFLCGPCRNLEQAQHVAIRAAVEQQCGEPKAQIWDRCRLYYASQQLRQPERNERVEYDNDDLSAFPLKLTRSRAIACVRELAGKYELMKKSGADLEAEEK